MCLTGLAHCLYPQHLLQTDCRGWPWARRPPAALQDKAGAASGDPGCCWGSTDKCISSGDWLHATALQRCPSVRMADGEEERVLRAPAPHGQDMSSLTGQNPTCPKRCLVSLPDATHLQGWATHIIMPASRMHWEHGEQQTHWFPSHTVCDIALCHTKISNCHNRRLK